VTLAKQRNENCITIKCCLSPVTIKKCSQICDCDCVFFHAHPTNDAEFCHQSSKSDFMLKFSMSSCVKLVG